MVAVEGDALSEECFLGLEGCSQDKTCPIHDFWKAEQERIKARLSDITLSEWAEVEACWKRTTP